MTDNKRLDVLAVFLDIGFHLESTSVFQSQVGDQLIALQRQGYRVGLLAVVNDQARFDRVLGDRLEAAGVEVFAVPERGFARNLVNMAATLRQLARARAIGHAYVRGIWGAVIIALAGLRGRLPYVFDVRGDLGDELVAGGSPAYKRAIYLAIERWSIRGATQVSAVTNALANVVSSGHGGRNVAVVPCCIDADAMTAPPDLAAARREELGYRPGDVVLVYAGGLSHYQQVPAMLAMWRRLRDEPQLYFLLLTNDDPHKSTAVVGDLGDFGGRLRHLSLPRAQVPTTLGAADIGFMLRDSRLLNRVASPVKFPEYLCAGLSIVGSPGTGDASALIERHDLGVLADPDDVDRGVAAIRALIAMRRSAPEDCRARARDVVQRVYDWRAQSATFAQLYGSPHALLMARMSHRSEGGARIAAR